jgi:hypothetical protein
LVRNNRDIARHGSCVGYLAFACGVQAMKDKDIIVPTKEQQERFLMAMSEAGFPCRFLDNTCQDLVPLNVAWSTASDEFQQAFVRATWKATVLAGIDPDYETEDDYIRDVL